MKQSVATTTVFKAVLVFTFLFAAFLAIAITYNKVYKMKNETVLIIEKYEGVIQNKSGLKIINNYLKSNAYNTKGNCDVGEYGVTDLDSPTYELADNDKKYYYCLSHYCKDRNCKINSEETPNGNQIFYKVKLFFKFNLPFLGDLFTFRITGDTKAIKLYDENQILH